MSHENSGLTAYGDNSVPAVGNSQENNFYTPKKTYDSMNNLANLNTADTLERLKTTIKNTSSSHKFLNKQDNQNSHNPNRFTPKPTTVITKQSSRYVETPSSARRGASLTSSMSSLPGRYSCSSQNFNPIKN